MRTSSLSLFLALFFLMPTWVKAACNSVYTLPFNEWHLISLPCDPGSNNSIAHIFGDDINGELTVDWAIYKFNAGTQSYVSLTSTDILEQGQGYWIINTGVNDESETSDSVELDMPATSLSTPVYHSAQCSSGNGCFEILLKAKEHEEYWNLPGFPFASNQAWNTSQIVTNDTCQTTACSVNEASSNDKNILNQPIWTYTAGEGYVAIENSKELTPMGGVLGSNAGKCFYRGATAIINCFASRSSPPTTGYKSSYSRFGNQPKCIAH